MAYGVITYIHGDKCCMRREDYLHAYLHWKRTVGRMQGNEKKDGGRVN
jgi:hypothetical protein